MVVLEKGSIVTFKNFSGKRPVLMLVKEDAYEYGFRKDFWRLIDIYTGVGYGICGYSIGEVYEMLRSGVKRGSYKDLRVVTNGEIYEIKETI